MLDAMTQDVERGTHPRLVERVRPRGVPAAVLGLVEGVPVGCLQRPLARRRRAVTHLSVDTGMPNRQGTIWPDKVVDEEFDVGLG